MDIFLIIGIVIGLVTVITGLLMKGTSVAVLINPEAALIILVGTFAAVMNSYPKNEFTNIPKLFKILFGGNSKENPAELINQIVELAQMTRKNGLLSLESSIQSTENEFMKKGLELVVDGADPQYILEVLETEIEGKEERHRANASVFTTAGGSSPTLGVLGAVIGLIGALANLDDTAALGEMIGAAFVATLYGIFFGYVIWHPFASRLKRKSSEEIHCMHIIMDGILAIQSGNNPKNIEQKLLGMLPPKERKKFKSGNEGE